MSKTFYQKITKRRPTNPKRPCEIEKYICERAIYGSPAAAIRETDPKPGVKKISACEQLMETMLLLSLKQILNLV